MKLYIDSFYALVVFSVACCNFIFLMVGFVVVGKARSKAFNKELMD